MMKKRMVAKLLSAAMAGTFLLGSFPAAGTVLTAQAQTAGDTAESTDASSGETAGEDAGLPETTEEDSSSAETSQAAEPAEEAAAAETASEEPAAAETTEDTAANETTADEAAEAGAGTTQETAGEDGTDQTAEDGTEDPDSSATEEVPDDDVPDDEKEEETEEDHYTGWREADGKSYWYEDGVRQGTSDDPKGVMYDGTNRGREIFDGTAWYWLDAAYDGARAAGKEVMIPYIYQDDDHSQGKWVRYDEDGAMVKGWYTADNGSRYYYDEMTGAMVKGEVNISGTTYYFDSNTGVLANGWVSMNGNSYWHEGGIRQGTASDEKDVVYDGSRRGREIYDPGTQGWYWLDADAAGARAVSKEVFMPYIYQGDGGVNGGKWVRYDENGAMIKGWYTAQNGSRYYYDSTTGGMDKGTVTVDDGMAYRFDNTTGVLAETLGYDVTKAGAVPNDGQDDTVAINTALSTLSSHNTNTLYIPAGTYQIDAVYLPGHSYGITPQSGQTIRMADGAVLEEIPGSDDTEAAIIRIRGVNNVTISGGKIVGDRSSHSDAYDGGTGIEIGGSSDITLDGVTITDCYGDGIYLINRNGSGASNVTIKNCTVSNSCRNNISVVAASNVTIDNCTLQNAHGLMPETGIDIEPNSDTDVSGVTISNTTIMKNGTYASIQITNHNNRTLRDVTIKDSNMDLQIISYNAANVTVSNTKVNGRTRNGNLSGSGWKYYK